MTDEKKWPGPWPHKETPLLPVVMRTDILADCVFYEVRVSFAGSGYEEGENEICVWQLEEKFDRTHRRLPGGPAFREAAKAQQRIANAWSKALMAAEAPAPKKEPAACRGCGERHGYRYSQERRRDECKSCGTPRRLKKGEEP